MKNEKATGVFFYINIGNFEAFLRNLNLSAYRLFWSRVEIKADLTFQNVNKLNPKGVIKNNI